MQFDLRYSDTAELNGGRSIDMSVMMPAPGFGPFRLLARAGQGPRGPVFIALRTASGASESPCLLEISTFATGEDDAERTFTRDTEAASRIQHRNVVAILDRGATPAGHYVATPYLDRCTLAELQDRHRAIRPPRLVIAAVLDALHGLHAAHAFRKDGAAQPLVHGSLCPEHLTVGADGTCRLAGFGNARPRVLTRPSHRSATATAYLAPEQLHDGAVDHRADLFAMGVVLWNALTGKKLFHDPIDHMTMSNVLERKVPRPSSVGLCPPPALDAIAMKALERDPERRFQSADELAGALRDVARGAACLAAASELAEWVSASFGRELAERRLAVQVLVTDPPASDLATFPPLTATVSAEASARDYLSLEELARAVERVPRAQPPAATPVPAIAAPDAAPRRRLTTVGALAFGAVASMIGWRWSLAASARDDVVAAAPAAAPVAPAVRPPALDVTVLEVRSLPSDAGPAPEAPAPAPAPSRAATTAATPSRSTLRTVRRPSRAAPPAPPRSAPAATAPVAPEPRPDPPTPEAPRPTLETNPYLYNK